VKSLLQPPYTVPYEVVKRLNNFLFVIRVEGKEITISTERLKPAYIAQEDSSYERQSSQPPRTYPGKKKSIFFVNDHPDELGSVTGEGEWMLSLGPYFLRRPQDST
jgi:hypothetical protein